MNKFLKIIKNIFSFPVLILVIIVFIFLAFYWSWESVVVRNNFYEYIKLSRSYYMARAGMEHFMLKLKTMKSQFPVTVELLKNELENDNKNLYNLFSSDINKTFNSETSGRNLKYKVSEFKIEKINKSDSHYYIDVSIIGICDDKETTISRFIKVDH